MSYDLLETVHRRLGLYFRWKEMPDKAKCVMGQIRQWRVVDDVAASHNREIPRVEIRRQAESDDVKLLRGRWRYSAIRR